MLIDKDKLLTLKRLGANQKEMGRYVSRQVKAFDNLANDLENNKVAVGISKEDFIAIYGDPVLSWEVTNSSAREVFLYRYPTKYFTFDKAYLFFDESGKLVSWEYKSK